LKVASEPEVDQHDLVALAQHDIGWLQVAVEHARRMHDGERARDLFYVAQRIGLEQPTLQARLQVAARKVFHREVLA
jgi:hypothetical protein